ncbi:unnamed protein product [Prorocentrum cordatum]|uniref:Glycerophosphocholine acyltransferase 1 n=1 Tax=Prorocentrum cordatum TaxID=2364126 RepID=A0ABN9X753_9DINO|nr:unnamed protein product [Polarella glacialis]
MLHKFVMIAMLCQFVLHPVMCPILYPIMFAMYQLVLHKRPLTMHMPLLFTVSFIVLCLLVLFALLWQFVLCMMLDMRLSTDLLFQLLWILAIHPWRNGCRRQCVMVR